MNQSIYTIKTILASNYYAFRHNNMTKVVYFRNYIDAQKVAAYLSFNRTDNQLVQLFEYYEPNNLHVYKEHFEIVKQDKHWLKFELALNDIGFHECEIVDDIIYCMDTGIFDIHPDVKSEYISDKLTNIIEI